MAAWLILAAFVLAVGCSAPGAPADAPSPTPAPEATLPVKATPGGAAPGSTTSGGVVREVVVGPEVVECVGSYPQQCLVVDGEFFYDPIEGFEHRVGYRYRLLIEEYDRFPGRAEIPQDTGRYGYRLVEVLEETGP